MLRSFKKDQRYWAIGQTVNFLFHFSPRDGAYVWISYYSPGGFTNDVAAEAKQSGTVPQQINYRNHGSLAFKHISLGWRKYLKGAYDIEKGRNLYGYAGFGLMMGAIVNTQTANIDTSAYTVPILSGKANFKRLTVDIGLGTEFPVGADIFIYFEGRALIPTTDYPSQYLLINRKAPFTGAVNGGIRVLFN